MNGESGRSVNSWLFAEALTQQNTARERTRALLKETARVVASHHLKESAGALNDEGKKSMRYMVRRYPVVRKGKKDT